MRCRLNQTIRSFSTKMYVDVEVRVGQRRTVDLSGAQRNGTDVSCVDGRPNAEKEDWFLGQCNDQEKEAATNKAKAAATTVDTTAKQNLD